MSTNETRKIAGYADLAAHEAGFCTDHIRRQMDPSHNAKESRISRRDENTRAPNQALDKTYQHLYRSDEDAAMNIRGELKAGTGG